MYLEGGDEIDIFFNEDGSKKSFSDFEKIYDARHPTKNLIKGLGNIFTYAIDSARDTYEDLEEQYKKIYNEISRGSVKGNSKTYEPVSEYEHPTEEQRIWTNQFKVVTTKLMIDLVAEQHYQEWVIWLRVYNLENLAGAPSY
jgi:hypothetical protein